MIARALSGSAVACSYRSLSTTVSNSAIQNLAIIGSGQMGSGIAQVSAAANIKVTMHDSCPKALKRAEQTIVKSVTRVAKKKFKDEGEQKSYLESIMANISTSECLKKSVEQSDLVIEAIVEDLDVKRKIFRDAEGYAKSTTILATNTSSLRLKDIATTLKDPSKFGGLHFFNPVPMMKLLEVVRFDGTSNATFDALLEYGAQLGKSCVKCKDTPGFIVNRLLVPYTIEAIRLHERGDASIQDIDTGMRLGAGYPMGPFELMDYIGLDTMQFIIKGWHERFPNETLFNPSPLLEKLVKDGKLGKKTGEGFYKH